LDHSPEQEGVSAKEIAGHIDISCRRVEHIWKYFRDHGHEPIIGNGVGRPRKPYDEKEAQIVKEAHCASGSAQECSRSSSRKCIMLRSLIIESTCTSYLRDFQFKIQRNRSDANGSGMNVNIACLRNISIGMKMSGQA